MALTYDLRNISNFETVCFRTTDSGETELKPLTHALIFGSVLVDMREITDENCGEFLARITLMSRLYDCFLQVQDTETGAITNKPYTIEMIRSHIGLKTNAGNLTRKEWLKVAAKKMQSELERIAADAMKAELSTV